MKNEKTSRVAASVAGKILSNSKGLKGVYRIVSMDARLALGLMELLSQLETTYSVRDLGTVSELRTICGSDLTQASDKNDKRKAAGKL